MTEIITRKNEPELPKYVLSVNERETIERELVAIDGQLKMAKDPTIKYPVSNEHLSYLVQRKRKMEAKLAERSPQQMNAVQKVKLENRAKELKKELKESLIPYDQMHQGPNVHPGVVEKQMKWKEAFEKSGKTEEYKRIMRTLDPHNPNAGNIELLRPKH